MRKRKILSPYYDFRPSQHNKSPYERSRTQSKEVTSRGKKVSTADEKKSSFAKNIAVSPKSSSFVNLQQVRDDLAAGDCTSFLEDLSSYQHLNYATKSCQTPASKPTLSLSVQRVSSQDFYPLNQQMMNKKLRDSQFLLRYMLKLSNNTFYATLKHEIESLKKDRVSIQNEISLQSQSIIKILKSQNDGAANLERIVIQNQQLMEANKIRDEKLKNLIKEVENIKQKPENHELAEVLKKFLIKNPREQRKISKSLEAIAPRSTKKKSVRVSSLPAVCSEATDYEKKIKESRELLKSKSDYVTNQLLRSGGFASKKSNRRTVSTNYSKNDISTNSTTDSSIKHKRPNKWYKLLCCV